MDRLPPPPQTEEVIITNPKDPQYGRMSLPWNLWLTRFIDVLQAVGDGLDAVGLYGGGSGGGVASSGAGPAVDLTLGPSAEGQANLGARANHTHRRLLGVEQDAVEAATTIQGLNVLSPFLNVSVEPDMTTDLQALAYGFWPLTEAAGTTRKMTYGTAVTSDLVETGGTVAVASGLYGNAVSCTAGTASYLGGNNNLSPSFDISSGLTVTVWIMVEAVVPTHGSQLLSLSDGGGYGLFVDTYEADLYPRVQYGSLSSIIYTKNVGVIPSGWHFLSFWYDPSDRYLRSQLDCGAVVRSDTALTAPQEALVTGLDSLWVTGNWRGGYWNWQGRVGPLGIFPSVLTQAQRERVMASRANVGVNAAALELFGG